MSWVMIMSNAWPFLKKQQPCFGVSDTDFIAHCLFSNWYGGANYLGYDILLFIIKYAVQVACLSASNVAKNCSLVGAARVTFYQMNSLFIYFFLAQALYHFQEKHSCRASQHQCSRLSNRWVTVGLLAFTSDWKWLTFPCKCSVQSGNEMVL